MTSLMVRDKGNPHLISPHFTCEVGLRVAQFSKEKGRLLLWLGVGRTLNKYLLIQVSWENSTKRSSVKKHFVSRLGSDFKMFS